MPNKITTKTKKETYYKCKKIWIDACLPVGRVVRIMSALVAIGIKEIMK